MTSYITKPQAESILADCVELIKILMSITKTVKTIRYFRKCVAF